MSTSRETDIEDLEPTRLELRSADIVEPRAEELRALFPEAVRDGKLDLDAVAAALGDVVDDGPERFGLTWPGKSAAIRMAQRPSEGTLVPMEDESVDWDTTKNVIVEGENLEVLKVLQRSYHGRVKLIYIDPPYNTGKDFVYSDNFRDPLGEYLRYSDQADENGKRLRANAETSGRYHSAWLSMMWPRLHVARSLLTDDGVLIASIDDHEAANLKLLLDEVFGQENFIAQLVWDKTRKNDAKFFSVGHEYLLVYARSVSLLRSRHTVWRKAHPGAEAMWREYESLRERSGTDDRAVERALRDWLKELPPGHPSKKLARYKQVDPHGPWRDRDISWPGGGGPRYDVIHPDTGQPCRVPDAGWRFASPDEMARQIDRGLVVFRKDHSEPPFRKAYLRASDEGDESLGLQVMGSYIHAQSQVAVKALRELFDGHDVFDNPKDPTVLADIFQYVVGGTAQPLVLDFFSGSAAAGEAVLNAGADWRYVLVQLAEPTTESTFGSLADVTRERMRRVDAAMHHTGARSGFRAYRLDRAATARPQIETDELVFDVGPGVPLNRDDEALLAEVLLARGFDLVTDTKWVEVEGAKAADVAAGALLACFARSLTSEQFEALVGRDPAQLVLLEEAFGANDEVKINALQHLKTVNAHRETAIELLLL